MYGYIYLTTNLINSKRYIGQKTSAVFLKEEYLGSGKILLQAVTKYGKENFKVELLEECSSKEELDEREKFWISTYNAVYSDNFYNLAFGGSSPVHKLSNEEKAHIGEQMRERQKDGGYMKGKHHSPETLVKCLNHIKD